MDKTKLEKIIQALNAALYEHTFLLRQINTKSNMLTMDGYYDYQTVQEANDALDLLKEELYKEENGNNTTTT